MPEETFVLTATLTKKELLVLYYSLLNSIQPIEDEHSRRAQAHHVNQILKKFGFNAPA